MLDALRWTPASFATWVFETDQRPGMVGLRENRKYAHEVAVELIEDKRRELKDGTSRRDVLSLLGSSCVAFIELTRGTTFNPSVKANSSLRPDWRLNDDEIVAQVR